MGLPGHDTYQNAKIIGEKDRFKDFAQKNHLMVIPSRGFTVIGEALNYIEYAEYPIIIKPTDLSGGKGVTRVLEKQEAETAVRYAFDRSKAKHIVIEPFISGTQHSITTFLVNEKVVAHGSFNEYSANSEFLVGASSCPADVPDNAIGDLINQIEIIASLLHLRDGLFHAQFILDQKGIPEIIECMRRPLGNHALEELHNSTGIDWERWIARCYCGMSFDGLTGNKSSEYTAEFYIQAPCNGKVSEVRISPELDSYTVRCINMGWSGMQINNYAIDKLGFLFLRFPDRVTRDSVLRNIKNYIQVCMDEVIG